MTQASPRLPIARYLSKGGGDDDGSRRTDMKVKGIGMHAHRCCGPVFLDVVNSPKHGVMLVICDVNVNAVHYIGHEKILNSKKLRTRNGNGKEDIDLVEEERQWENDNSSEGSIDDSYWW